MTSQHPLTDARCRDIANDLCYRWKPHVDQGEVLYAEDDMRAAYDAGRNEQLEQVIEWIRENLHEYSSGIDLSFLWSMSCLVPDLEKAMRPTQENN